MLSFFFAESPVSMNFKLPIFFLCCTSSFVSAFTVAVTNVQNPDSTAVPILSSTTSPIALNSGSLAVGYFSTLSAQDLASTTNLLAVIADFQQFGGSNSEQSVNGFAGLRGFFEVSFDDSIPFGGNHFTGNTISLFIGNNSTLETSNFFAIYQFAEVFGATDPAGNGGMAVSVESPVAGLVRGNNIPSYVHPDLGDALVFNNAIQLVSIPELSSAITAMWGLFLVISRRTRSV